MVEDSDIDAELIQRALRGLAPATQFHRVQTPADLRDALADFMPDIVLSDYAMPAFSGLDALAIKQELAPQLPFIFISGTIPEGTAIQTLKAGASDYLLKDNLARLQSAVESAVAASRERSALDASRQALKQSEARFRSIVEQSHDWIWEADAEGRISYSNDAVREILGYEPSSLLGKSCGDFLRQMHADAPCDVLARAAAKRTGWSEQPVRGVHRDGSSRYLSSSGSPVFDATDAIVGFRGIDSDITEFLAQERSLRQLGRFHALLGELAKVILRAGDRTALLEETCRIAADQGSFLSAAIGVVGDDNQLHLVCSQGDHGVNRYLECLSGLPLPGAGEQTEELRVSVRALVTGQPVVQTFSATPSGDSRHDEILAVGAQSQLALPIGQPPWGVISLYSSEEQRFSAEEVGLLVRMAQEIDFGVEFLARNDRLNALAYHDAATGLYNLTAFLERAPDRLQERSCLLAMVHVNHFARVRDSRGRESSDALLRVLGQRLRTDFGPDTLVAHPGDAAFLMLMPVESSVEDGLATLDRKLEAIEQTPLAVGQESIYLTLNAGVAIYPEHGDRPESLYRNADAALSAADARGERVHLFANPLRERAERRLKLEHQLRDAVAASTFQLHFQPRYRTVDRQLVGAEALLRWRGPEGCPESPAEFIPVLEETGMILQVGAWVMRTAQDTALAWRAKGLHDFRVAVNMSARELRSPGFLAQCRELLGPHVADPLIDIEITESLLMDDIDQSVELMEHLRALGCQIAIDDFGTGYSSLNYLARLPADVLKIDQSFTATLASSPQTMALFTNIIGLAHSLSLTVVAEGVEDEEQAKLLRLLRCDELQGYLLGRPLSAQDFEQRYLESSAV